MSNAITFQSIANSSLPTQEKSALMKAYERITGREVPGHLAVQRLKGHAKESVHVIRAGGEALVIGALAGLVESEMKNGLDITVKGKHIPADGVGALAAYAAGVYLANDGSGLAIDARNTGTALGSIFSYRMMKKWRQEQKSGKVHGDIDEGIEESDMGADEDPIIAAARALG